MRQGVGEHVTDMLIGKCVEGDPPDLRREADRTRIEDLRANKGQRCNRGRPRPTQSILPNVRHDQAIVSGQVPRFIGYTAVTRYPE